MKASLLKKAAILIFSLASFYTTFAQVQVVSPNGGETWVYGNSATIQWQNLGVPDDFYIYISEDNGANWLQYYQQYGITGMNEIQVFINFGNTDLAKVKIESVTNPQIFDESNNVFSVIYPEYYIFSPPQGVIYYQGSEISVQWWTGNSGPVNINFSADNGVTWIPVGTGITSYPFIFTAPVVNSTECVMKVSNAANPTIFSLGQVFSVLSLPEVTLLSPNGGEIWNYGESNTVSWSGKNLSSFLTIDISYNGGSTWEYYAYVQSGTAGGTVELLSPAMATENALLHIYDVNFPTATDVSDAVFTVDVPPFIIYEPIAGSTFFTGQPIRVSWQTTTTATVNIELSLDGGITYQTTASNIPSSQLLAVINGSATASDNCKLKIVDSNDPSSFALSPVFRIINAPLLSLVSPNGGELLDNDSTYSITLTYSGELPESPVISFDFSADNGRSWNNLGSFLYEENQNSFQWKTPLAISDSCLIRISDINFPFISDSSQSVFAIKEIPALEICMVSVDSSSSKNQIVWNRVQNDLIDEYVILKETNEAGVYQEVGSVSKDSVSVFIDPGSNSREKATRYKLSFRDSNGTLYGPGKLHQTIHLAINQGVGNIWNLFWTPYLGFPVISYNIYRGSDPDNMQLIGTVSGNFSTYTDLNAAPGILYYMIEVINPNNCNPAGGKSAGYSSSTSNIETNKKLGIEDEPLSANLSVYPNPATDQVTIKSGLVIRGMIVLSIVNSNGNTIKSVEMNANDLSSGYDLFIDGLAPGMYTVLVRGTELAGLVKFIKTR
ncbi:MAG: T9SS type A sorting domain-containing protein [Bacteroidales bacterium]